MYELIVKLVCDEMNIRRCIKKSIAVHQLCFGVTGSSVAEKELNKLI